MDILFGGQVPNEGIVHLYMTRLIKNLGMGRLRKPYIEIEFTTRMDALGYCQGDIESACIEISKQCPETGRNLTFLEMMRTLAHEMIHAKQFIRGQLVSDGGLSWKGDFSASNQPWEEEAYKFEDGLFVMSFPFESKFKN